MKIQMEPGPRYCFKKGNTDTAVWLIILLETKRVIVSLLLLLVRQAVAVKQSVYVYPKLYVPLSIDYELLIV